MASVLDKIEERWKQGGVKVKFEDQFWQCLSKIRTVLALTFGWALCAVAAIVVWGVVGLAVGVGVSHWTHIDIREPSLRLALSGWAVIAGITAVIGALAALCAGYKMWRAGRKGES